MEQNQVATMSLPAQEMYENGDNLHQILVSHPDTIFKIKMSSGELFRCRVIRHESQDFDPTGPGYLFVMKPGGNRVRINVNHISEWQVVDSLT